MPTNVDDKEDGVIDSFNSFIKKWTGDSYPHLIDSDENDGERFRDKLRLLLQQTADKDARIAELEAERDDYKKLHRTGCSELGNLLLYPHPKEQQARIASLEQVVRELTGAISQVVDVCSSEFHIDTYQFECFHVAKRAIKHSQEVLGEKESA